MFITANLQRVLDEELEDPILLPIDFIETPRTVPININKNIKLNVIL